MSDWERSAFQMLVDLRGGLPACCDFCKLPFTKDRYPVPEEAGEWACRACETRWQIEDAQRQR